MTFIQIAGFRDVLIEADVAATGYARGLRITNPSDRYIVGKLTDDTGTVRRRVEIAPGETLSVAFPVALRSIIKQVLVDDAELPAGWTLSWSMLSAGLLPEVIV